MVFEDKKAIFVDGLIEDISHRKEAEEVLIRKSEELGRSNADLEQFAFIASHDLQEPLRGFSLYTTMLKTRYSDQLDENARNLLNHMESSTERMYVLINDLLSFARINSQEAKRQHVSIGEILEKAIFTLKPVIDERGVTVEVGELPSLMADKVMLSQVFQNLLGNAIKFCRERPPRIRISAEKRGGEFWEFALQDNGIGIPARHLERIFGVFKRLHRREEYAGTGIGLALCRKVIERHGGRIWAESEEGVGATFRFTLPDSRSGLSPDTTTIESKSATPNGHPGGGGDRSSNANSSDLARSI
jgi:light-regulated signal transduction histidine kinase (bacteriophytochrome)